VTLPISGSHLSFNEIKSLMRINGSCTGASLHDLRSHFLKIRTGAAAIEELLEENGFNVKDIEEREELMSMLKIIVRGAESADRLVHRDDEFRKQENPFIANPGDAWANLSPEYPDAGMSIRDGTILSIDLVYPISALTAIMNELLWNASRHRGEKTQCACIQASWHMTRERFVCSIEDNGPGIIPDMPRGFVSLLDLADTMIQDQDTPTMDQSIGFSGLRVVAHILDVSEGILLFRRSRTLGGTEALFEIPTIGVWVDRNITRSGFTYSMGADG
jgi:hypothetical protein